MKKLLSFTLVVMVAVALAGCAMTTADRYALGGSIIGGAAGAAAGAVIGAVTGNPAKGAAIGGVAGAAIGGLKGYTRGAEIEQQQAAVAAAIAAQQPWRDCTGWYDHLGNYQYYCGVRESGPHINGIPNMPLPPPAGGMRPIGVPSAAPPAVTPPPPPPASSWQERQQRARTHYPVRRLRTF